MEYFKISLPNSLVRINPLDIVYIKAEGNYSTIVLTNGTSRTFTFQLIALEKASKQLLNNPLMRVGRSYLVNKHYIYVVDLTEQILVFAGREITAKIPNLSISRDSLKQLKQELEREKLQA
ncbi:MAG: LytTR family transcriptional regulator [Paludibacteraceae bacterium]|nr:LytTR family transcriptional regulator [Paludibacteraceae bacterium]